MREKCLSHPYPRKTGHCIVLSLLFIFPNRDTSARGPSLTWSGGIVRGCECERVNLTFRIKTSVCLLASTDSVVTTHFVSILIAILWSGCDQIIKVWCTNQASVLYGNVKLCFFFVVARMKRTATTPAPEPESGVSSSQQSIGKWVQLKVKTGAWKVTCTPYIPVS